MILKEAVMAWLRQNECQEGTRKKTTVRVIELGSGHPELITLDSVQVGEL